MTASHRRIALVALAVAALTTVVATAPRTGGLAAAPPFTRLAGTLPGPTTTLPSPPAPPPAAPAPAPAVAAPAPPPPSTPAPPSAPAPADSRVAAAGVVPVAAAGLAPYVGLGTWVDVYDWSRTYGRGATLVGPADVDEMARVGVQTLFIQTSKWDAPGDVLDPDLLGPIVGAARAHGIRVVGWYLPTLEDPGRDLARLLAIDQLGLDGIAVDIESRAVGDVAERNRRLVELSAALRQRLPGRTLGAIVLPPVQLEALNNRYWSPFPYGEIAPLYDVWLTMGYWSVRRGEWRDAYRYTTENVVRLRRNLGRPDAFVHPIGGVADGTTPADVEGFLHAAVEQRALGGSLYDWRTSHPDLWPALQPFRGGG